jgi:hypothetical protein
MWWGTDTLSCARRLHPNLKRIVTEVDKFERILSMENLFLVRRFADLKAVGNAGPRGHILLTFSVRPVSPALKYSDLHLPEETP